MSETHDPWATVELLPEDTLLGQPGYFADEVDAARAAVEARHQQEIAAKDEHIAVVEGVLREHSEFGGLFQPGGRFHRAANLRLGGSAVADGGRWLVARLAAVEAERDRLLAALKTSEARIYPDVNFERYLDDTSSTLVELVNDLSDGGDEHASAAIRQATEAIAHLRRTREELRLDLERIARAALSGEGTKP